MWSQNGYQPRNQFNNSRSHGSYQQNHQLSRPQNDNGQYNRETSTYHRYPAPSTMPQPGPYASDPVHTAAPGEGNLN